MKENTTSPHISKASNSGNESQQGGSVQFTEFSQSSIDLRLTLSSVGLFLKPFFQHEFLNQSGVI